MEGVFGAPWGRLESVWGGVLRAPEASKTMCFTMVFGVFTFWPLQSRQWLLKRRLWTTWGVWEATCGRSSERLGANLALQKRLGAALGPSWQRLGVSWGAFLYPKSAQNHVF